MTEEPHPKIIVDDDWKSKVQAEKESLRAGAAGKPTETSAATAQAAEPGSQSTSSLPPLPPPSFALIVSTFATEALIALGQFPRHDGERPAVMLDHAKHFIDTIGLLEEKTKGNLTDDEAAMIEGVLHQLRMAFVTVKSGR